MIIQEYLETRAGDRGTVIACRRCGHVFCDSSDNYKRFALRRTRDAYRIHPGVQLIDEPEFRVLLQEYYCPGCATQLQVDVFMPDLDESEPLWDIQLAPGERAAGSAT